MKKILALAAVAMLALTACSSSESGSGVNGTFEGTGTGIGGSVKVTLTVENSKVTKAEFDCSTETATIGQVACTYFDDNDVVENSGADFDNYSGATVTSKAVKTAVTAALQEAGLAE